MHPIEHLRYVARAQGVDPSSLAVESLSALQHLSFDPSGLVVACRRVVERHPTAGALWWACAHLLTASDPGRRAGELISELYADPTEDHLVRDLPSDSTVAVTGAPPTVIDALCRRGDVRVVVVGDDRQSASAAHRLERAEVEHVLVPFAEAAWRLRPVDLVLVEADSMGGGQALVERGGGVLTAVAVAAERSLWLVAGCGRYLPTLYLDAMRNSLESDDAPPVDQIAVDRAATIVRPAGAQTPSALLRLPPDCPFAAELVPGAR